MNLNRRRNIYTLGDIGAKANLKRHQQADPFERDPFKVQSYNFRYAERPSFPVVTPLHTRVNDSGNDCQTFFYNYDFPNNNLNIRKSSVLPNDQRALNLTKFQDFRRKKFLQESTTSSLKNSSQIVPPKPNESKLLNVYNDNQNSKSSPNLQMKPAYMQMAKPSYTIIKPANDGQTKRKTISSPRSDIYVKRGKSFGSGCEINISIRGLEDNSLQDNVNIKIETDSICKNLSFGKSQNNYQCTSSKHNKLERFNSAETFVVDKNLSKYTFKCHQESQEIPRKRTSDRVKELTSIYSTSVLKKSATKRNLKPNERLPSFMSTGVNNSFDNYQNMNNNLNSSQSLLEKYKPKDYKSISNNDNSRNISCNNLNSPAKRLQSIKQIYGSRHSLPVAKNRTEFKTNVMPLQMKSNAKLPINVNINVYADKLKLLKV